MLNNPQHYSATLLESRFIRFLLAGGLAALINFGSRFVYNIFVDFSVAVVLAFMTGLAAGYMLNKRFVFTMSKNSMATEMGWFVLINLLALAQTWGLSVYLAKVLPEYLHVQGVDGLELAEAIAHGAGVLLPVFTSFIGHKYLTFRE